MHDSLLPKYRGFAPLPNALINGEREVGVTALFASEEYDMGDIVCQRRLAVEYPMITRSTGGGKRRASPGSSTPWGTPTWAPEPR
jgi:methionyl-tRNA formyltransferase